MSTRRADSRSEWLSFQLLVTNAEALQPGDKLAPPNDEKSELRLDPLVA